MDTTTTTTTDNDNKAIVKKRKLDDSIGVTVINTSLNTFKTFITIDENTRIKILQYCGFREIHVLRRVNSRFNHNFINKLLHEQLYLPDVIYGSSNIHYAWIPPLIGLFTLATRINNDIFKNLHTIDFSQFCQEEYTAIARCRFSIPIPLKLLRVRTCSRSPLFASVKSIERVETMNQINTVYPVWVNVSKTATHLVVKQFYQLSAINIPSNCPIEKLEVHINEGGLWLDSILDDLNFYFVNLYNSVTTLKSVIVFFKNEIKYSWFKPK